ncbi:hypothetical protein Q1695_009838 [Nippostrongylus brasiliensis]|nr:hypothetical protein Q1695_009838 [Nippostrongylus brasiliensis]
MIATYSRFIPLHSISARLLSTQICPELAEVLHKWQGGQVDLTSSGDVARLRLNRPDKSNCLSGEMMFQLGSKAQELEKYSSCGVLVVEGVGRSFCSGADLGLIENLCNPSLGAAMCQFMSSSLGMIRSSPLVSVARLHGHSLGGGTEIASSCDIRAAHKDSQIGFLQARMGIVPSWGGGNYLASIVGRSTALRLMTTASILSAAEAKDVGFVDFVYESDEEFEAFIASMLKHGTDVCKAQKAFVDAVLTNNEDNKLAVIRSVWGGPAQRAALTKQINALKKESS